MAKNVANVFGRVNMQGACEVIADCCGRLYGKGFHLYSGDKFNYSVVSKKNGKGKFVLLEYKDIDFPPIFLNHSAFKKFCKLNTYKFIYN